MGEFAAKQGDRIEGTDTHIEMVFVGLAEVPTPIGGHDFKGDIVDGLASTVMVEGSPAAIEGSIAQNSPRHSPKAGTRFQNEPDNEGEVTIGSTTVFIEGSPAARNNDTATTCDDLGVENQSRVVVDQCSVSMG